MAHYSVVTVAAQQFSSSRGARAAFAAPCFVAILSLCGLANAQVPATEGAPPAPVAEPTALPAPSVAPPAPAAATPSTPPPAEAPSETPAAPGSVALPVIDDHTPRRSHRVHEGFYLRVGGGPSFLSLRGHGPSGTASLTGDGQSGFITIGGAIVPGLVLAGTLEGVGFRSEFKGGPLANATITSGGKTRSASHDAEGGVGMIGLLVDWYPKPTGGWHAGGSAGLGAIGLTNVADDSSLGGVNFSGSVFGGYDWSIGRDWALGLQLTARGGTQTKLREDSGDHDTGYRLTPLSLGIQGSVLYF